MLAQERAVRKGRFCRERVFVPNGTDFAQFGKNTDRCKNLLSYVYERTLQPQQGFSDWIPLPKQTLEAIAGRYYPVVRDVCIEHNLLQPAERYGYAPGHHCRHYRLGRKLWHRNWITEPTETAGAGMQPDMANWPDAYRHAAESAMIVQIAEVPESAIDEAVAGAFARKPRKVSPAELQLMYRQQIESIRYGMIGCVRDEFGRLHTPVTSLPKAFRWFITLDGEPLAGVDIQSSQPLFLGLMARDYALRGSSSGVFTDAQQGISPYALPGADGGRVSEPGCGRWLMLCEETDFYLSIRDRLDLNVSRDRVKSMLFGVLYGPNLVEGRLLKHLRAEFPEIVECILATKEVPRLRAEWSRIREGRSYPSAWAAFRREYRPIYGRLACEMQRVEAAFVFGQVVPRLQVMGVPVVTIHDSVLVPRSLRAVAKEVVDGEFRKIGIRARLHEINYGLMGESESSGDGDDSPARRRPGSGRVRRGGYAAQGTVPNGVAAGEFVAA